ncbi:MAG: hypothetical protein U0Q12_01540 [Vicinamibacterales bacterium]
MRSLPPTRRYVQFVLATCLLSGVASAQTILPVIDGLSREQVHAICRPILPTVTTPAATVIANRDASMRVTFGPTDTLVIDRGRDAGLAAGQTFVVRHGFPVVTPNRPDRVSYQGDATVAWVRLTEVADDYSLAEPVYTCKEIVQGDGLYPYETPASASPADGTPDFEHPARVLFGDDGRTIGGEWQEMVIDRGSDGGMVVGQRLTMFRRTFGESGPRSEVGVAVVVATEPESATIRLEHSRDAVHIGDFAAPHAVR